MLELLVVIVIIGLLAAYVGPRYFSQLANSQRQSAQVQMEGFSRALQLYRLDVGRYPRTEQGLSALVDPPGDAPGWAGPYLQKGLPPDPWGHPYQYRAPGTAGDFDLLSLGRDGRAGGTGEDADLIYQYR